MSFEKFRIKKMVCPKCKKLMSIHRGFLRTHQKTGVPTFIDGSQCEASRMFVGEYLMKGKQ